MTIMPNGQHRQVFPEDQAVLDRINEQAEIASSAFNQFRWQQTMLGGEVTSTDKQALRDRLRSLDDELDRLLAAEYGVNLSKPAASGTWLASHHPFHWFVEFYGIMSKGGFDVVIGTHRTCPPRKFHIPLPLATEKSIPTYMGTFCRSQWYSLREWAGAA